MWKPSWIRKKPMRSPLPGTPRSTVFAPAATLSVLANRIWTSEIVPSAVDLVDAEGVGEGRDGRLELEREADRAVAGQERTGRRRR